MGNMTSDNVPGVAILGCGLIGHKRARALGTACLVACVDLQLERAQKLARECGSSTAVLATADPESVVRRDDINIVIVAAASNVLAGLMIAARKAGKHVLVDKPAARNSNEVAEVLNVLPQSKYLVSGGFYL